MNPANNPPVGPPVAPPDAAAKATGRPDAPDTVCWLDGEPVPLQPGDTILQAARRAGRYIPHLCWHPDHPASGNCRLCNVQVGGRSLPACTTAAQPGTYITSDTAALNGERRTLVQMLFVEGNHFCPSCEKSGNCLLQATAYQLGMDTPRFEEFFPDRPVDCSHPEVWLDLNRCIACGLCVRASAHTDGKSVFAIGGHSGQVQLVVNSATGLLVDSTLSADDAAAHICPVGAILPKRIGFAVPIGERRYDRHTAADADTQEAS